MRQVTCDQKLHHAMEKMRPETIVEKLKPEWECVKKQKRAGRRVGRNKNLLDKVKKLGAQQQPSGTADAAINYEL